MSVSIVISLLYLDQLLIPKFILSLMFYPELQLRRLILTEIITFESIFL